MEFENIFTPNSTFNFFSPYSCGAIKQGIENLFDSKGHEESREDPLNQILLNSPLSLDFPSPLSINIQNKHFQNNIPNLELPLNVQKKLDQPKKETKKNQIIEVKNEINVIQVKIEEKLDLNSWRVIFSKTDDFTISAFTKTRCDKPTEKVDDVLYSSLKYEIKQFLFGKLNYPFLLSKICVVDSVTGEQIQKNNKSVLKGQIECTITNSTENKNETSGILKVQFTDVSYHHKKGDFCWEISYFAPNELNQPLLTIRSTSFKVFARKPSQLSSTAKKRKKDEQTDFNNFCDQLEELVKYTKKLKNDDKKIALNLISEKLSEFEKNLEQ